MYIILYTISKHFFNEYYIHAGISNKQDDHRGSPALKTETRYHVNLVYFISSRSRRNLKNSAALVNVCCDKKKKENNNSISESNYKLRINYALSEKKRCKFCTNFKFS